ncbi:hypothetical protein [Novosphingobium sp. PP1Y]|uniref:hypothetical protein n=1 Tax=Novosphingobium sp. PP1Y TaxID=702113 RepID=UPI00020EE60E|nr:hypothetical protein [Novosphingobium sp. PP1Y]CCA89927.1 conserved hypothetical protein [Novosphingobium sp. PP1Y]
MTNLHLSLDVTDTVESATFDRFFEGYEENFTLPEETEDRSGFSRCLALNHGTEHARLARQFGAFRELCVVARDAHSGQMIGGANFISLAPAAPGLPATANLNYLYICPAARGRGALRTFIGALSDLIGSLFGKDDAAGVAIFIEQNDPFSMSREAYERDSEHSGMDQFARLLIWARMQARVVDFPYVQPPLSDEQSADDTLVYSVMGISGDQIDPAVLRHHLAGFFGISVLKGAPLDRVAVATEQLNALERMRAAGEAIALLDPLPYLRALNDPVAELDRPDRPHSIRSALSMRA